MGEEISALIVDNQDTVLTDKVQGYLENNFEVGRLSRLDGDELAGYWRMYHGVSSPNGL
jgi:hypothetical protein